MCLSRVVMGVVMSAMMERGEGRMVGKMAGG